MSDETADQLATLIDGPVRDAVAEVHSGLVTNWATVIEYLDADGAASVAVIGDDQLTATRGIGLAALLAEQHRQTLTEWIAGDGEGD